MLKESDIMLGETYYLKSDIHYSLRIPIRVLGIGATHIFVVNLYSGITSDISIPTFVKYFTRDKGGV